MPFVVDIDGPNGKVPAQVTDNGDGTYRVDYEPTAAGNHKIEVTLKEEQVANSPYNIRVDAGAWAPNTGIKHYSFVVETRDRNNQPKTVGGESENFEVTVAGPGEPKVKKYTSSFSIFLLHLSLSYKKKCFISIFFLHLSLSYKKKAPLNLLSSSFSFLQKKKASQ